MSERYSVVPAEHKDDATPPEPGGGEQDFSAANSDQELDLVKIASKWKRRDQGTPDWWRNHIRGMFR